MDGMTQLLDGAMRANVPLNVLFELTNRCNEDCTHCYVDLGDVEGELSTAEVCRILGELRAAGTLFLTFSGGEIFTRRDLLELVRHARSLGFALRLFTNGSLVRREHVEAIAAVGVVAMEVSVYAMDPETHDRVTRIPGSHARTVRAVRMMREAGLNVVLKAPLMAGTSPHYDAVLRFAAEVGADYRFDPSLVARYDLDTSPLDLRIPREQLLAACIDPRLGLAIEPGTGRAPDPEQAQCSTARKLALVSARGLVYPCSQRFPPAGDLRQQSFGEIWSTSPLLLRLRAITAQDLVTCSSCTANSFCGRCALDALIEGGDFWGPSPESCRQAEVRQEAFALGGATMRERLAANGSRQRSDCDL
jgi:radical SAM protein with 4Fe4S-binding SPASM domain